MKVVLKEKPDSKGASVAELDLLELAIVLKNCEPRVERTLVVYAETIFGELHEHIQAAMGWENAHLHEFVIGDHHLGSDPDDDPYRDGDMSNENDVRIMDLLPNGKGTIRYIYDFGDDWIHEIKVKPLAKNKHTGVKPPVCTGGKGACPPEDCGGVWGYAELLEGLRTGSATRKREIRSWLGAKFDPEAFDVASTNKALR